MFFHRTRRTCVLVPAILITFPLYFIIFLLYKENFPGFHTAKKLVKANVIEIDDNDSQTTKPMNNPYFMGKEEESSIQEETLEMKLNEIREKEEPFAFIPDISNGNLLQDIDTGEIVPNRDQSAKQIFFVETSHPEGGFLEINPREACAIESAAKMHPEYLIYVLFAGRIAIDLNGNSTKIVRNLLEANKNVHFRRLDVVKFAEGTPMEVFFKSGRYKNSKHLPTHLADILRLVTLWKYGGLYFDLDVVVIKNHAELGESFLVKSLNRMLMSGTMQFGGHGIGHTFVEDCLKDLVKHFRGGSWAGNGPDLVTRRMQALCGTRILTEMTEERCQGMKVLEMKLFLPIWYPSHKMYFASSYSNKVFKMVENSYTAHIFNHMNHHLKLRKGWKAGYLNLAEKYCPVVYGTLDDGDPF